MLTDNQRNLLIEKLGGEGYEIIAQIESRVTNNATNIELLAERVAAVEAKLAACKGSL